MDYSEGGERGQSQKRLSEPKKEGRSSLQRGASVANAAEQDSKRGKRKVY